MFFNSTPSLANIAAALPTLPGRGQPQQAAAAPTTGAGTRGFIVEIVCTTPRADAGSFVLQKFVTKLQTMKSTNPAVNYSVKSDFVKGPFIQPVGSVATGQTAARPVNTMIAARPGEIGFGGRAPAQPTAAEKPKFNPNEDPVTKEDMSSDQRATIRMMVQLDPPKPENSTPNQ